MEKPALLKKLDAMLDEAARSRMWGSIEIELRDGEPKLLRKTNSEVLYTEANPRANKFQR